MIFFFEMSVKACTFRKNVLYLPQIANVYMKFNKEAKIAVVVTLIMLLFLWGFNFLKGRNLFSAYNYYQAYFEKIDGLQKSNAVTINGFAVGLVSDIRFASARLDTLVVEIGVMKNFSIPDNSVMMLSSDLMSGSFITLLPGDSKTMAKSGDFLSDSIASDIFGSIAHIADKLKPAADNSGQLISSIDSLVMALRQTLDENMQKDLQNIVANVEQLVATERRKISAILSNFESVSANLQRSNDDVTTLIANLNAFSETLAASDVKSAVDNANQSLSQLNSLLTGIGEGQGTLGKFATDDSLYVYLQRAAEDLDKLLIDLRENPKRYVHFSLFGGRK